MIDKRLYCETFSKLQASPEAKKEVLNRVKYKRPMWKTAGLAAVIALALVTTTAGAANLVTNGQVLQLLRDVWLVRYEATDEGGNEVAISITEPAVVSVEEGRMLLHAAGETVDITDAMEQEGAYHLQRSAGEWTVVVSVEGSPEEWTLTETLANTDGIAYTTTRSSAEAEEDVTEGTFIINEGVEDAAGGTYTINEGVEDGVVMTDSIVTITEVDEVE